VSNQALWYWLYADDATVIFLLMMWGVSHCRASRLHLSLARLCGHLRIAYRARDMVEDGSEWVRAEIIDDLCDRHEKDLH
jgi:hypothetical protein